MAGEFSSIVCSDGLDDVLERLEEMYHHFSQSLGILALVEFSHEEHVGASLNDCDNGTMVVFANNGVHLEVSEALAVRLFWTLVNAYPIGYRGNPSADRPCPVLELVTTVLVEVTALPLVLAYDGIYGLMGYRQTLLCQTARDLFRRPLLLLEQPYGLLLDVLSDRSVARATMLMIESILLGCLPVIASSTPTVSLELARYGGRTDLYSSCYVFFLHSLLE